MFWIIATPSKTQYDTVIKDILASPGYSHLRSGLTDMINRIKEKLSEWIFEILKKSFSNMSSALEISNGLSVIFMIIGILLIFGILILIIVKGSKTFDRRKRVKEILGEKIDSKTTPLSLRGKASDFEQKGDFRNAIRFDFIALLLLMHEKGLLYLDETKTNSEILNYLNRSNYDGIENFRWLVEIFNSSWYGHKAGNLELYRAWSHRINQLWDGVIENE